MTERSPHFVLRHESKLANQARRAVYKKKTIVLKLNRAKLSKLKLAYLALLFTEAKWFYNHVLSTPIVDLFNNANTKVTTVTLLNRDKTARQEQLTVLSSHMRQAIHQRMIANTRSLAAKRNAGAKIGRLKFKSYVNSVPLKEFGRTYRLDNNSLRIELCDHTFKLVGVRQLKDVVEYSSALLVRKANNYFLHLVCYVEQPTRVKTGRTVGLDLGVKTTVTTSDGVKYDINLPESDKLKRLQSELDRKVKGSNCRRYHVLRIQKEHARLARHRRCLAQQFIAELLKSYDSIYFQDDAIASWKTGESSKKIQHSAIGTLKAVLAECRSFDVVPRYTITTGLCYRCGRIHKLTLKQRTFVCDTCGATEDRDIHAARVIKLYGLCPSGVWRLQDVDGMLAS